MSEIKLEDAIRCAFLETVDGEQRLRLAVNAGYEIKKVDEQFCIYKRDIVYPKTYSDCCKILKHYEVDEIRGWKEDILNYLQTLLLCRNAYWSIAGEWKPEYGTEKYYINHLPSYLRDLFPFPTEEMADNFWKNFENELNSCKKLL